MGYGIETVGGVLTNAAAVGAQTIVANTGQSFTVRAAASNTTPVNLASVSAAFQDSGEVRIRSPRMHDDSNAMRLWTEPTNYGATFRAPPMQPLFSTDALIVEGYFLDVPTVNHISTAYLTIIYDDVPGINANMRTWAEVQPNIKNILSVPLEMISSATAGQWGATQAINALVDVFKANTLYAVLGYVSPVPFGCFTIQGVDNGNLQFGASGNSDPLRTRNYFIELSNSTGRPCIPIINSNNKGTTNIAVSDIATSTEYDLSIVYAELAA